MVVIMKVGASERQIQQATHELERLGFRVHRVDGVMRTILGAIGDKRGIDPQKLAVLDGVEGVVEITKPYKLASREFNPDGTIVSVGDVQIGGQELAIIAGPCSVESEEQIFRCAQLVAQQGVRLMRGGAFKPRTSPYSFQGLGEAGLKLLRAAADQYELSIVTEVLDTAHVDIVAQYADVLQIGARNMQNFALLKEVGRCAKPVLLKRGIAATLEEWLMAAEYILNGGNKNVVLCERGIRTFSDHLRFTLDVGAVSVVKELSHLPVIVDPSHAAGVRTKVIPLALAGIAAGADGLIVEVHHDPDKALCDGPQALLPEQFKLLMDELSLVAQAVRRRLVRHPTHMQSYAQSY
uniref:3-deoxy-7-phosphoheptulonate synthase n=2 Tax=Candidatus Bipolaricaulota TaxID=67810 RepID=H5SJS9_9BACT|nr:3-deoxy-7-phosphoheptulonate synthase [uncultured Acetothermia bacterium]BAL59497.1 3-deoxy-D-arabinoheptulosonate-7-phosphate synthase [Candidatus Acetothermum autotrophicum]